MTVAGSLAMSPTTVFYVDIYDVGLENHDYIRVGSTTFDSLTVGGACPSHG
jgi:hypothetical protein